MTVRNLAGDPSSSGSSATCGGSSPGRGPSGAWLCPGDPALRKVTSRYNDALHPQLRPETRALIDRMRVPIFSVPVNVHTDLVLGNSFHFPAAHIEGPGLQFHPPGYAQEKNKFTRTVFHRRGGIMPGIGNIVLKDHELGHYFPHVPVGDPITVALAIPKLYDVIKNSSCKVMFSCSIVKMDSKPVACVHPLFPMLACGTPIKVPATFSPSSLKNNVYVGISLADFLAGLIGLAGEIIPDVLKFLIDKLVSWLHSKLDEYIKLIKMYRLLARAVNKAMAKMTRANLKKMRDAFDNTRKRIEKYQSSECRDHDAHWNTPKSRVRAIEACEAMVRWIDKQLASADRMEKGIDRVIVGGSDLMMGALNQVKKAIDDAGGKAKWVADELGKDIRKTGKMWERQLERFYGRCAKAKLGCSSRGAGPQTQINP